MVRRIFLTLIFILAGFEAGHHFFVPDYENRGLLLFTARALLEGKKLYVDLFEINPPLVIWFYYTLPVFLSKHIPLLNDMQFLVLCGLGLMTLSAWISLKLMAHTPAFCAGAQTADRISGAVPGCFPAQYVCTQFSRPRASFHVLVCPFILRFLPSLAGANLPTGLRISLSVMAALGFCIKPQCFVLFAGIELLWMWRERSWSPLFQLETLLVCGLSALYALSVLYFTPDYLYVILPMALATYSRGKNLCFRWEWRSIIFSHLFCSFCHCLWFE